MEKVYSKFKIRISRVNNYYKISVKASQLAFPILLFLDKNNTIYYLIR